MASFINSMIIYRTIMQLFHERHYKLLFLAILGGVYLPSLSRIVPWKSINIFFKGYAATLTASLLFCTLLALRHTIFLADNLIVRIMAANNVFNDGLCCGRALLFNIKRNQVQDLYDLWDVYFTGDGHDEIRKELLENLKKPNKKYLIGSAAFIQFMLVSWSSEQFSHENCEFSVPIGLPFNNRNPEYLIWVTFIFICFSLFGPMLLSVDALIMEPLTWLTAEFMRLQKSLHDILNTIKIRDNGEIIRYQNGIEEKILNKHQLEPDFKIVDQKIRKWIGEHQKLLIFHQKMLEINHWPLAIQLFCTTMTICLISFIVATKLLNAFDTFIALLFFVPNYILFYITSTYGNLVNEQAADVFNEAFATSWSIYPKNIQTNLHIIAMRTNYALHINIMKQFPLGSKTYFQIVQTAYSFYSFLRFLTSKHEIG